MMTEDAITAALRTEFSAAVGTAPPFQRPVEHTTRKGRTARRVHAAVRTTALTTCLVIAGGAVYQIAFQDSGPTAIAPATTSSASDPSPHPAVSPDAPMKQPLIESVKMAAGEYEYTLSQLRNDNTEMSRRGAFTSLSAQLSGDLNGQLDVGVFVDSTSPKGCADGSAHCAEVHMHDGTSGYAESFAGRRSFTWVRKGERVEVSLSPVSASLSATDHFLIAVATGVNPTGRASG